nr:MAG: replication initiator protein [Microvirus sp.]
MSCTAPMTLYKVDPALNDGKAGLTKNAKKALLLLGQPIFLTVACGKCADCRLQRSYEWSLRIMHENSMHSADGSFVTLTYSDAYVPADYGLHYRDFQLFMHRLRKAIPGAGRFFMSGEYGDEFGRPHFHAILFNCDFPDKVLWKRDPEPLYTSEVLSGLWDNKGFCTIGAVTLTSAGYCARYAMKKIMGPASGDAYQSIDKETGEVFDRSPPFCHMSLKPGIGYDWFMKYYTDCFPCDFLVHDGRKFPVPRYYTKLFEDINASSHEKVLRGRRAMVRARKDHPDNTPRRLRDRWEVSKLNADAKKRM